MVQTEAGADAGHGRPANIVVGHQLRNSRRRAARINSDSVIPSSRARFAADTIRALLTRKRAVVS